MSRIELKNIDKFYGKTHILKGINLTIEDGDFMTLLGPSGCGKTTTLRVVSGLEKPQNGTIYMDDKEIVNAKEAYFAQPSERDLNLVFQSYALWPHMTVRENIAFGLNIKKLPKAEVERRVMDALGRMQIAQYADRYPNELSGGQQQRVAIARAIASEPHLLLLDEPLSNLDAKLRVDMRSELKRLHTETGTTMIYVTHDQVEALTMSTKIAIFRAGVIVQVAKPLELYNNPANIYVADFIGNPSINFIPAKAVHDQNGLHTSSVLGKMDFPTEDLTDKIQPAGKSFDAVLGIRPEQITINKTRQTAEDVEAKIYTHMPAGSETLITVEAGGEKIVVKALGICDYEANEIVYISIDTKKMNVFEKESTDLIKYSIS
ncbi:MAG: ABC transporter ATP-binding protein [Lachnospiraceae bacterium]|nr:ABC transporter ATP-binding protein [Lachnospiraceae bacterium]